MKKSVDSRLYLWNKHVWHFWQVSVKPLGFIALRKSSWKHHFSRTWTWTHLVPLQNWKQGVSIDVCPCSTPPPLFLPKFTHALARKKRSAFASSGEWCCFGGGGISSELLLLSLPGVYISTLGSIEFRSAWKHNWTSKAEVFHGKKLRFGVMQPRYLCARSEEWGVCKGMRKYSHWSIWMYAEATIVWPCPSAKAVAFSVDHHCEESVFPKSEFEGNEFRRESPAPLLN